MTASETPAQLEFPCDYPIKVMGYASEVYAQEVLAIFAEHAPGFDESLVRVSPSSKGTFASVHVVIRAEGADHIDVIFQALKTLPAVRMVI